MNDVGNMMRSAHMLTMRIALFSKAELLCSLRYVHSVSAQTDPYDNQEEQDIPMNQRKRLAQHRLKCHDELSAVAAAVLKDIIRQVEKKQFSMLLS